MIRVHNYDVKLHEISCEEIANVNFWTATAGGKLIPCMQWRNLTVIDYSIIGLITRSIFDNIFY